jgi:hypothetical protein
MCPDGDHGFEWEAPAGSTIGVSCTGWPLCDSCMTGSDSNAGANAIFRLDADLGFISGNPKMTFIPLSPDGADIEGARWRSLIDAASGTGMEPKISEVGPDSPIG